MSIANKSVRKTGVRVYTGTHGILPENALYFYFWLYSDGLEIDRGWIRFSVSIFKRYDPPLQCKSYQFCLSPQMKLAHQVAVVHFNRTRADG
jgi:hypothetical protein